ncbi:hypothetical protein VUR80DRAFT_3106 [Thermomyces stellatus]
MSREFDRLQSLRSASRCPSSPPTESTRTDTNKDDLSPPTRGVESRDRTRGGQEDASPEQASVETSWARRLLVQRTSHSSVRPAQPNQISMIVHDGASALGGMVSLTSSLSHLSEVAGRLLGIGRCSGPWQQFVPIMRAISCVLCPEGSDRRALGVGSTGCCGLCEPWADITRILQTRLCGNNTV